MPTFNVDFEVFCLCGEGLCNQSVAESGRRGLKVIVSPCPKCQEKAYERGYDKGTEDASMEVES